LGPVDPTLRRCRCNPRGLGIPQIPWDRDLADLRDSISDLVEAILEFAMLVGHYVMAGMLLGVAGVELEPAFELAVGAE
jgi:hypothetical protein